MRLSAVIPNAGSMPTTVGLGEMGRTAEEAGAEGLWVSDHLLMVHGKTTSYPFSADGRPTWPLDTDYFEALTCCTHLAAVTQTCRIGTAVLVLPQRHTLEFAKVTATIDRLSDGRLDLGVGAGWNVDEMAALGHDPATRGARFDRMLHDLRDCWTGRPRPSDAERLDPVPPDVLLFPTPVQQPGPPLIVGGTSDRALQRAATLGDGWMGIAFMNSLDVGALRGQLDRLRALRSSNDGARTFRDVLKLHAAVGEHDRVPDALAELRDLPLDEIIVDPPWAEGLAAGREFVAACRGAVATVHAN